jgi:hypothetical protein
VRSCYYALTQGNIFAKPDRLQTNFRSHDGIIQTANNVLHLLGLEFPDSFDKLDVQTGLATGIFILKFLYMKSIVYVLLYRPEAWCA